MAGLGTRFLDAGYATPKPLLPVHGVPMYRVVLGNLLHPDVINVTFIAQRSWQLQDDMNRLNEALPQEIRLIEIDYTTAGPADTVELARSLLDPDLPVVTGNSDQYVNADLDDFYQGMQGPGLSGLILTMEDDDPKWSFAAVDGNAYVTEVREKRVISRYATVGIYGFKSAEIMFRGFDLMRAAQDMTNSEFYIAPSYNWLIRDGHTVGISHLGPYQTIMHGLGTPADYVDFLGDPASRRAAEAGKWLSLTV